MANEKERKHRERERESRKFGRMILRRKKEREVKEEERRRLESRSNAFNVFQLH